MIHDDYYLGVFFTDVYIRTGFEHESDVPELI